MLDVFKRMRSAALITTAFTALAVGPLLSCNRSPTGASRLPSARSGPAFRGLELIAPSTLAPGTTTQVRLVARWTDGREQDVTASASFESRSPDIIAISPSGIATALMPGETIVIGLYERASGSRQIVVVPDGTFRVAGRVVEEERPGLPIAGAQVETDGSAPPVTTDSSGNYRLYGVPGQARIRVSKAGYVTKELGLSISNHHTQNVALALAVPRLDVSGAHQMTFEASPECRDQLPEAVRTRRYAAEITHDGALIGLVLSGSRFYPFPYTRTTTTIIGGWAGPASITLYLFDENYDGGPPMLLEIVDDSTHLAITGGIELWADGRGLVGTLDGEFRAFTQFDRRTPPFASCRSMHRVTLSR